jgi:hypothetical protein
MIVTTDAEHQMEALYSRDWAAAAAVASRAGAIVVMNGGMGAGASQRHKHMHVLLRDPDQPSMLEAAVAAGRPPPYPAVIAPVESLDGDALFQTYRALLQRAGLGHLTVPAAYLARPASATAALEQTRLTFPVLAPAAADALAAGRRAGGLALVVPRSYNVVFAPPGYAGGRPGFMMVAARSRESSGACAGASLNGIALLGELFFPTEAAARATVAHGLGRCLASVCAHVPT